MRSGDQPLRWIAGEIKSPPFSRDARIEAGLLLRRLQRGEVLGMPHSRVLAIVGRRCHELRIRDKERPWRIVYRLDPDAVLVLYVFSKQTRRAPRAVIKRCQRRLRDYDNG